MAARSVTCLLISLLFATWISFAQPSQGEIPDSNRKTFSSTGKGLLDGGRAVTAASANKNWLGGRKMVVGRQMKNKDVKMRGAVEGTAKFSSTNSKCGNNLGCSQQSVSHFSDEVNESGFVAFSSDYHAPRHHPPKNN